MLGKTEGEEVAPAPAPVRASIDELGSGQGHDQEIGTPRLHSEQVVDEVEQAVIGHWRSLEQEGDDAGRGQALEERPPRAEQLVPATRRGISSTTEQSEQGHSIQRRSSSFGTCVSTISATFVRVVAGSSVSSRPGAIADHPPRA